MRGLKPRPLRVLVRFQAWVHLKIRALLVIILISTLLYGPFTASQPWHTGIFTSAVSWITVNLPPLFNWAPQVSHLFFFYLVLALVTFICTKLLKIILLLNPQHKLAFPQKLFLTITLTVVLGVLHFLFTTVGHSNCQPVYQNTVWSLCYFSHFTYSLLILSTTLYVLPNLTLFTGASGFSKNSTFTSQDGLDLIKLMLTPILLIFLVHVTWSGPSLTAWFGHIVFSQYQFKVTYLLFFFFTSYMTAFLASTYYSSTNIYDYTLTTFNFFIWIWLVFFSNNLFTFIFFLELLSASITLLLVTSTFTSAHFYSPLSYSKHNYFQSSTPTALLQTLLFFFWVTLVSSLMLFLFLIVFYFKFLTFDWNLVDSVFNYLTATSSIKSIFALSFSWLLLLICVFIKCGIAPFYLWKPMFFKGMTIVSLFFYVYVYYFSIFLFFTYVIFFYLNELFFTNLYLVIGLLVMATITLFPILFESFYVKSFLALSSVLNSVLIFYALCSYQASDFIFIL